MTAGGLTDRYLSDYPNAYADMSAGSGLNALTRDEDHAREFLRRHQDKILYGSDCNDPGRQSAANARGRRRSPPSAASRPRRRSKGPRKREEVAPDLIRDSIPRLLFSPALFNALGAARPPTAVS